MISSKQIVNNIQTFGFTTADVVLFLTALFWGVNFSVVKFALVALPPIVFTGLRFVVSALIMVSLTWVAGYRFNFERRHFFYLTGLGLLGNTSYQLFFIYGIDNTSANNSSLILATVPVWVALIGTIIGTERVQTGGWLGVLLSLVGIVLIILGNNPEARFQFGGATLGGDLLILLATLCWTGYTLLSRPMLRRYPSVTVSSFSTVMGAIPLLLISTPALIELEWGQVPFTAWAALVFSGLFAIALAYFFWNYGVSRLGSTRTSLYSNLTPPISLLTAWLALGETLTPQQWLGTLLTLGGIILARRFTQS